MWVPLLAAQGTYEAAQLVGPWMYFARFSSEAVE